MPRLRLDFLLLVLSYVVKQNRTRAQVAFRLTRRNWLLFKPVHLRHRGPSFNRLSRNQRRLVGIALDVEPIGILFSVQDFIALPEARLCGQLREALIVERLHVDAIRLVGMLHISHCDIEVL